MDASKRRKTVESSTYSSELVATRGATKLIMKVRYTLRMLGVPINQPAMMLGDNMSVGLNTSTPSGVLKKKHSTISYHRVKEAIAAKILRFVYTSSEKNLLDFLV